MELKAAGYLAMSGQIVDASIVAAPKQRNTEAEKAEIRPGASLPPGRSAGQIAPEGSGRALDSEVQQSQAA